MNLKTNQTKMKYLSLKIDQNTELTFENSIWGRELIKLNGVKMSEKTSIWGSVHDFENLEEGNITKYTVKIEMNALAQIKYLITRNGQVLVNDFGTKSTEHSIRSTWFFIALWLGIMIFSIINGTSMAVPLCLLPVFLAGFSKTPMHRKIDLLTSKSI
jgi:hypothetical protein